MDQDGRTSRALGWFADTVLVGGLTILAALPVFTAPAAFTAATEVLRDRETGGGVAARYVRAMRVPARQRLGAAVALLALLAVVLALVDVAWALSAPLTPLRTAVLAAGVLLAAGAAGVVVVACSRPGGETRLRPLLVRSAVAAAAAPHRLCLVLLAGAVVTATSLAVPPALPVGAGLLARLASWAVPDPTHSAAMHSAAMHSAAMHSAATSPA